MCYVSREVNTEANGDNQTVAGNHIYGESPEEHEPSNFNNGGKDTKEHKTCTPKTSKEQENCDENS